MPKFIWSSPHVALKAVKWCKTLAALFFTQLLINVRENCKYSTYNRSNSYYN